MTIMRYIGKIGKYMVPLAAAAVISCGGGGGGGSGGSGGGGGNGQPEPADENPPVIEAVSVSPQQVYNELLKVCVTARDNGEYDSGLDDAYVDLNLNEDSDLDGNPENDRDVELYLNDGDVEEGTFCGDVDIPGPAGPKNIGVTVYDAEGNSSAAVTGAMKKPYGEFSEVQDSMDDLGIDQSKLEEIDLKDWERVKEIGGLSAELVDKIDPPYSGKESIAKVYVTKNPGEVIMLINDTGGATEGFSDSDGDGNPDYAARIGSDKLSDDERREILNTAEAAAAVSKRLGTDDDTDYFTNLTKELNDSTPYDGETNVLLDPNGPYRQRIIDLFNQYYPPCSGCTTWEEFFDFVTNGYPGPGMWDWEINNIVSEGYGMTINSSQGEIDIVIKSYSPNPPPDFELHNFSWGFPSDEIINLKSDIRKMLIDVYKKNVNSGWVDGYDNNGNQIPQTEFE